MPAHISTALLLAALTGAGAYFHLTGEDVYWPGFAFMVFFYGAIFYLGAIAARGKKTSEHPEEMMLAGRALPLWMGIFTMSATWVGGGYINGTAEYTASSGLVWVQAPWGYALSLVIGGVLFARPMRRHGFTTMLDPIARRFGDRMGAALYVPALLGEMFWTAAILTALGTTFGTIMGIEFEAAIILSACVAIAYTALGGLWAVALTDVLQLGLLMVGLWIVVPIAAQHTGGISATWDAYVAAQGPNASLFPPLDGWRDPAWGDLYWSWWDYALLLVFGGIPWHVYFQRVLASKNENVAMWLSIAAGAVCLIAAIPAVLIGAIGSTVDWSAVGAPAPESAALTLPHVFRYLTHPLVASIGMGALSAAVMSSVDSSILSASSMAAWNVYRPLVRPKAGASQLASVIKRCVWIIGIAATLVALKIKSVYALWFLCSDFVYCLLFPQLLTAIFDRRANRIGSIAGLVVSLVLRLGGGEPVLGIPRLLPYPMVDDTGAVLFPFRTLAMVCGLATILIVSRLTARWVPARALAEPPTE